MSVGDEVMSEILGSIEERATPRGSLAGLEPIEADLLTTVTAIGIIGNGGFRHWYEGMTAEDTERCALGFERLGLTDAAAAMRGSHDQDRWDELDNIICDAAAPWRPAALRYAVANAAHLRARSPAIAVALDRLERAWDVARRALSRAVAHADAGSIDRDAVLALIAADVHPAAHTALLAATPAGGGRRRAFWSAMREAADAIAADDGEHSRWQHRFVSEGYLVVDAEVVHPNERGVRILESGPARWHTGNRRRWFGGRDTQLYARADERRHADGFHLYDRGTIRLVPAEQVEVGTDVVVQRGRTLIARGRVVEVVPPDPPSPA